MDTITDKEGYAKYSVQVNGVSVCEKYAGLFRKANFKAVTGQFDLFS